MIRTMNQKQGQVCNHFLIPFVALTIDFSFSRWLDKLGLSARLNEDIVIRQTLFGGRYALLDSDMNPNPVSRKIPSAFYLIAILT